MAQAESKKRFEKNCVDVERVILDLYAEEQKIIKCAEYNNESSKHANNGIKKLLRKAKLNTKYLEETVPISNISEQVYFRNYGLY